MKTLKTFAAATATAALLATGAIAANPEVGGAPMFENKNIVENAVNSADHTTLVAAVKARLKPWCTTLLTFSSGKP